MADSAPNNKNTKTGPTDRRQMHAFFWAVLTGGTPCQTCSLHDYCAAKRATCADWHEFVETGKILERARDPRENTL